MNSSATESNNDNDTINKTLKRKRENDLLNVIEEKAFPNNDSVNCIKREKTCSEKVELSDSEEKTIINSAEEVNNDNDTVNTTIRRKRKDTIEWIKEKTFPDNDSFLNFIKEEKIWSYKAQSSDSDGNTIIRYRCNKVKFRGPQCSATLRVVCKSSTDEVSLYRSAADHNHEEILSSEPKLHPSVKATIKQIFAQNNKIRPKKLLEMLSEKHVNLPTYKQIVHFLQKLRADEYAPSNITFSELETLIIENTTNSDTNDTKLKKQKRRELIDWIKIESFSDNESVLNFLKQEETWSYQARFVDSYGNTIVRYRCNKVKFKGPQCSATIRVIYKSSTDEICLYRSAADHDHEDILTKSIAKLLPHVKDEIKSLFVEDNQIRPKKVIDILVEKQFSLPTYRQVVDFLNKLRLEEYGRPSISLSELKNVLMEHTKIPENGDISFVVDYEINDEKPTYFRFFLSTKTLMKTVLKTEHLHASCSGNYKLTWQGFPVLIIGTTDRNKEFHCCGIAVCSNETTNDFAFIFQALKKGIKCCFDENYKPKVLIADATENLANGFQQIFGNDTLIIMCWLYMHKSVKKQLQQLISDKTIIQDILNDIESLQLSKNAFIFVDALNLFLVKWESVVPNFIEYFKENWIDQNCNWYEASCTFVPNTNYELDNFTKAIIDEHTLRERLPISKFIPTTLNYLTNYSNKYTLKLITFHETPNITLETWTKAYNWTKINKEIISFDDESSDDKHFKIPGKKLTDTKYCRDVCNTFNEFKEINEEYYNVVIPENNNYLKGECDCSYYLKNFTCKHVIGMAIKLNIVDPPPETKFVPSEIKRSRGRPSNVKKALISK